MSKTPNEHMPTERGDRRDNYQTDKDRSKQQGERPGQRGSMADKQAGLRFTSDEDIVKGRKQ